MMNSIHLPILIEQDEDGIYIVTCNTFKGCYSYGRTVDEAMENIKEVIAMCMDEEKDLNTMNQFIGFRELEISL